MCGRYTLTSQEGLVEEFQLALPEPAPSLDAAAWWRPRWNIAPTQPAPIVPNRDGPRHLELARWGLVPPWAESMKGAAKLINARSETAAGSRAFRDALARRRCLVPADGFFEWPHDPPHDASRGSSRDPAAPRAPRWIHPSPRRPIAFAGIWERWKSLDHAWVISFAILTTAADALVAPLHDRMPIVLARADYDRWLDPAAIDPRAVAALLAPAPLAGWTATEVTARINKPDFDEPF